MTRFLGWMAAPIVVGLFLIEAGHGQTVEAKPLVEVGIAGVGGTFPDYPASAQNHLHALPLPYIIYRGEYLQLAPNSIRGLILNSDKVTLDISASGAFESSHDDAARAGMPGLDYTGQIGPRLNLLLAHDAAYAKIDAELPVRAVFSTNFKTVAYRGVIAAPEIAYTNTNFIGGGRVKFGVGPEFASGRLMEYFYSVAPQFVIPGRPQYNATGGYLGSRAELSYRYPLGERASIYVLAAPELYAGATNEKSPLFKKQYGVSAALGFNYSFYGSTARATGEIDADAEPVSRPQLPKADMRNRDLLPALVPTNSFHATVARTESTADIGAGATAPPLPIVAPSPRTDSPPASPPPDPRKMANDAASVRPVAQIATGVVSVPETHDHPSAAPTPAELLPAAAQPAQQRENNHEQNLSGWVNRMLAQFDGDPQAQHFFMTSDVSGDPRITAARFCAHSGHVAMLDRAERNAGATPDQDKIVWHFSCRN